MNPPSAIDPAWAWAPFEPSADAPWNLRRVAHLYRRAGFAASSAQLQQFVVQTPEELVDQLLDVASEPAAFRETMASLVRASLATGSVDGLAAQWAYRMLGTPLQLLEKMTLFWHGHFATSAAKVEDVELMQRQNALFRHDAIGDFPQLLLEISRDPAMQIYLDSASNRKAHPNENYAREIMELFCLGEGNYSEKDIRELARCFTGWEVRREKFRFNRYQHDNGEKTVLGESGNLGGEDGVRIVAQQPTAPRFIASKLVRFFVMDEPRPSPALIEPLARQLRENGFRIAPTLKRIFCSNLFFSEGAIGRKIRSPVELGVGFLRALEGTINAYQLTASLRQLGQGLFYPPSVKGWDGGRSWINSSTLLGRSNLIRRLIEGESTEFGDGTLVAYLQNKDVRSADDLIHFFQTLLFAVDIPDEAKRRVTALYSGRGNPNHRTIEAVHLLCTLPQFHSSRDRARHPAELHCASGTYECGLRTPNGSRRSATK